MKWTEVGCAIIVKEGKILIAQRHERDSFGGCWEFPGGKREPEESIEECLIREIAEELGIVIRPRAFLRQTDHEYPQKKIRLFFYFCDWVSGIPECLDCQDFRWIKPEELKRFRFPKGDEDVIAELMKSGLPL